MYLSEEINLAGSSVDTPYIVMFVGAFGLLLFSVSHFHCQPIFKLLDYSAQHAAATLYDSDCKPFCDYTSSIILFSQLHSYIFP